MEDLCLVWLCVAGVKRRHCVGFTCSVGLSQSLETTRSRMVAGESSGCAALGDDGIIRRVELLFMVMSNGSIKLDHAKKKKKVEVWLLCKPTCTS